MPPPLAPAHLALRDVEYGGTLATEKEAIGTKGQFVCMAELDDTRPACVRNADGHVELLE